MSNYTLRLGDCLDVLRTMPDNSVDSIVTDPPYGLSKEPDMMEVLGHWMAGDDYTHKGGGFMGKKWDSFVPGPSVWRECLRVLKPGGHLLAFFGSRTYDMGTLAVRLAGFEIRDQIMWVYGSGFPKNLNVSKAIDKAVGAERERIGTKTGRAAKPIGDIRSGNFVGEKGRIDCSAITSPATDDAATWDGWGTALKPAHEPIVVARKPLIGTVVKNVLTHGTGAVNIGACRVDAPEGVATINHERNGVSGYGSIGIGGGTHGGFQTDGRWPANLIHDGHPDVVALFPAQAGANVPVRGTEASAASNGLITDDRDRVAGAFYGDTGSAARFFYCAKTSATDRHEGLEHPGHQFKRGSTLRDAETLGEDRKGNAHPTVKPTDLMAYLVRLVTPPGGTVLDPYMGSGSTGKACMRERMHFIGIEIEKPSYRTALKRIRFERNRMAAADQAEIDSAYTPQLDLFAM